MSGGAEVRCYRLDVRGYPSSYETGPFCPKTVTDGMDAGGIWVDGTSKYDVDGPFVKELATIYGDAQWHMYDDQGNVFVTDTAEKFEGAARPDVDPDLENHCVEGKLEWLTDGKPVGDSLLIPVSPVAANASAEPSGNQGVTLDGVVIAEAAPVSAILGAHTIAAFDDCGGHFNPIAGYHLHAATGCSESGEVADGDTPIFGYAVDGYPVHSPLPDGAATELDECNGHTVAGLGYHYHANAPEKNKVIKCVVGQFVAETGEQGPGGPAGPPPVAAEG